MLFSGHLIVCRDAKRKKHTHNTFVSLQCIAEAIRPSILSTTRERVKKTQRKMHMNKSKMNEKIEVDLVECQSLQQKEKLH